MSAEPPAGAVAPKVFVSYTHDSPRHTQQVLDFATFLRGHGVDAVLDRWSNDARRDWYSWAIGEMTGADYVIAVASKKYRATADGLGPGDEHKGAQSEAALLRELVHGDRGRWLPKILPVVLFGHDVDEIPLFLQPNTANHYVVTALTLPGADELLRVIFGRPAHVRPALAQRPSLPPLSGGTTTEGTTEDTAAPQPQPAAESHERRGSVHNVVTGTVVGSVIQAGDIHGDVHF